jgi:hypothetical protein
MTNILGDDRKRQVLALGRLGWPLRRIEQATGVRRETASAYLKAAGVTIRAARHRRPPPKPASQVSTDPGPLPEDVVDQPSWPPPTTSRAPQASACEPYRDLIEQALGRGRNPSRTGGSSSATPRLSPPCSIGAPSRARAHLWPAQLAYASPQRSECLMSPMAAATVRMTHRALGPRTRAAERSHIRIPPSTSPRTAFTRHLLDHQQTRYTTLTLGRPLYGRFCPVHVWPVLRCPPRLRE